MFSFFKKKQSPGAPVLFTNTLSGEKERFAPLRSGEVLLYSCGPTVYGPQHIGNLRAAVFSDVLARTLTGAHYRVRKVVNITDVGHMVGDGDAGEDKMAVGAKRDQTTPEEIAKRYTKRYLDDLRALNIDLESIRFPKATEYIPQQIEMIQTLEEKGFAYRAKDGIYFDTSKFPDYGKLGGIMDVKLMAGARVKMVEGKRSLHDFALWRFAKKDDLQKWDSPWGSGNPGWSIECSAMAKSLLGETIDIHTGGEDHVGVHHNNEIAQSEAANGRILARYWMHNAFLTIDNQKVSKSLGNIFTLADVVEHGMHPLALRLFFLQAHYRSPLSFSWEALAGAEEALRRLWRAAAALKNETHGKSMDSDTMHKIQIFLRDDLATPQALACLFDALSDEDLSPRQKWGVLEAADSVFGLSLTNPPQVSFSSSEVPSEVRSLAHEREQARAAKEYAKADELRAKIEKLGYEVADKEAGPTFTRK